jgi:hypothetical protein
MNNCTWPDCNCPPQSEEVAAIDCPRRVALPWNPHLKLPDDTDEGTCLARTVNRSKPAAQDAELCLRLRMVPTGEEADWVCPAAADRIAALNEQVAALTRERDEAVEWNAGGWVERATKAEARCAAMERALVAAGNFLLACDRLGGFTSDNYHHARDAFITARMALEKK